MCRLQKLLFFTLIVGCISSTRGFNCPPQLPPICECSSSYENYMRFTCKTHENHESFVSQFRDYKGEDTSIYCVDQQSDLPMNEVFPAAELGYQEYVKIELTCPLRENATVKSYFDRLGLTGVTKLMLFGSRPSKLKKEIFIGTSNIINLNLYHNNIVSLPSDLFEHLSDLATIELSQNTISSLPSQLFSKNKKLKSFTLTKNGNSLPLPSGLLGNLPNFESANLQDSKISSVPFDLFSESRNIKYISLAENALETVPEQLFSSQISLEELDLRANNLKVIPADLFKNTVELVTLVLAQNKIGTLPATLFENSKKLRKIDLAFNEIETLPDTLLSSLDQLEELDVHYNRLQRLTSDMLPAHITSLDIKENRLGVIDRNFLIRFKDNLYNHFAFNSNPIICSPCSEDLLAIDAISSKLKAYFFYVCSDGRTLVVDAIAECKLRLS